MAGWSEIVSNWPGHERHCQPGSAGKFFDAGFEEEVVIGRLKWIRVLEVYLPLAPTGFGLCGADGDSGCFHGHLDRPEERLLRDSRDDSIGRTRGRGRLQTLKAEAARLARIVTEEIKLQLRR
jgi:hypothetical protein